MSANYESGEIPPTSRMNKLIHRNAHFACTAALLNSRYTGMAATRPLISPEPFSGECSWTDWVDHFEAAATVNGWDDSTKLKWLPVRLTGKAQVAWRRSCQLTQKGTMTLLKRLCASVLNQTARDSGMQRNSTLGSM